MTSIYKNDWLEIFEHDGAYMIRYDSGDIGGTLIERIITKEEAIRMQESVEAADMVIWHHKNIERLGEDYMERWLAGK